MPKDNIDYSETIIYKIYCKDESINDVYVGHTTNFTVRKHQHKLCSNSGKNDVKIYNVIRKNGGWDNWNMVEIAKYNCKDSTEARIKEQYHYELLNASLNSCPPYVDIKNYFCLDCKLQCYGPKQYNKHINCNSHKKILLKNAQPNIINTQPNVINTQPNVIEIPKINQNFLKFYCELCEYKTNNKKDLSKHLSTLKHLNNVNCNALTTPNSQKIPKIYKCNHCNKIYKYRDGLWRHSKNCKEPIVDEKKSNNNTQQLTELVLKMVEQNQELTKQIIELIKTGGNNHYNTNDITPTEKNETNIV